MPKKKILFQLNELGVGGTTKAIQSFCAHLDKKEFEAYLFYYSDKNSTKYFRRMVEALFSAKAKRRFQLLYQDNLIRLPDFERILGKEKIFSGDFDKFKDALNEIKPDIIHFNRGDEVDFYTERIDQIPNDIKLVETSVFGVVANQKYVNRVSQFYFVSEWLKSKADWCPEQKSLVLYNPINLPASNENLRQRLGIPALAFVVGRIIRPNSDDCKFVLDVFKAIDDGESYFFMIGGSDLFVAESASNPRLINLPATADEKVLSQFYNTLDVLLHWRQQGESFGMNIVEGMIHEKPVVSHKSVGNNAQLELLADSDFGPVGLVADVDDLQGYVKCVKQLKSDVSLRKSMGQNAKMKAEALFEAQVITQRLTGFYKSALSSTDLRSKSKLK